jgi:2-keto-4-pentenoate hydratase/2-oxohepta-3-ene-1,7-dioic acid hydratase in catechol pathway
MRLCSFIADGQPASGVLIGDEVVDLRVVNEVLGLALSVRLGDLVKRGEGDALRQALSSGSDRLHGRGRASSGLTLTAPYADPPKIWCIGLNYRDHAADLAETSPEEPASFMRPAISMRGPGDPICLPPESARVTGEAELAVVIGRRCKYITRAEAHDVIAAFVPAIDMTAEDILRRNPRFLTRAKSFDTFLSLGPFLVTPDEIGGMDDVRQIGVTTLLNGAPQRTNTGLNMTHDVYDLIAFHSRVMTWEPGDILLTGTPGAVVIRPGDTIGCQIDRVGRLENPVLALPGTGIPFSRPGSAPAAGLHGTVNHGTLTPQ